MSAQCIPEYQPLIPKKLCPDCKDPNATFGVNRSKRSGLAVYCRKCNAARTAANRGEYVRPKVSRTGLIKEKLQGGPMTRKEIKQATGFDWETLCSVLVTLMVDTGEVESWAVETTVDGRWDEVRYYRLV